MPTSHPNRIILSHDTSNNHNKLYFNTSLPILGGANKQYYSDQPELGETNQNWQIIKDLKNNLDKTNNRIILSIGKGSNEKNATLIHQQNIFHNMKFIHKNGDLNKPMLIFKKYTPLSNGLQDVSINTFFDFNKDLIGETGNNNEYLKEINILGKTHDISNNNTLNFFVNFYSNYNNSDYYKFDFNDFSLNNNVANSYNVTNIDCSYTKSLDLINYDISNFQVLYKQPKSVDDSSVNKIIIDSSIESSFNSFIYNKLNNLTSIKLDYHNSEDSSLNFFLIKNQNAYNKYGGGKIILKNGLTYINTNVIQESYNINNIYYDISYNYNGYIKNISEISNDFSNNIFLSLGKNITGFTQHDLFKKTCIKFNENINSKINNIDSQALDFSYGNIEKILFLNKNNIQNNIQNTYYNSIGDNHYLFDSSYNYDYPNITYFNIFARPEKTINIDMINSFYYNISDDLSMVNNIYNNKFQSIELIDNSYSNEYFDTSYNQNNIKIKQNNGNTINNNYITSSNSNSFSISINNDTTKDGIFYDTNLLFDFKFNYKTNNILEFSANFYYIIDSINSDISDISFVLNFYKLNIITNFQTTGASDFTNVDCIFVYHDPVNDPCDNFLYPNNNIEIIRNPSIDTLSKAIELLPGARTSTTNSVFIPAKNGSNLSRKMIQGLIGLNKVPELLSIEPYDPSFIDGRGFINQFQINNACLTDDQRVNIKQESQKHNSVKNNFVNTSRTNFAKVVTSRGRNRFSLDSASNSTNNEICNIKPNINSYNTPFRLIKTNRGKYLASGK